MSVILNGDSSAPWGAFGKFMGVFCLSNYWWRGALLAFSGLGPESLKVTDIMWIVPCVKNCSLSCMTVECPTRLKYRQIKQTTYL